MDAVDRYLLSASVAADTFPDLSPRHWETLTGLAYENKLVPRVWRALHPNAAMPAHVREELQVAGMLCTVRALFLQHQLLRITMCMDQAEVPYCPLKGTVLAQRLFGDPTLRQSNDIDLLVPPAYRTAAIHVLEALGFVVMKEFSDELDHHTVLETSIGEHVVQVELHTGIRFNNRPFFPQLWWDARVPLELGGHTLSIFRDDHLLVFLCMHAAGHGYAAWGWLADIAALIRCGTFTWEAVVAGAREAHLARPVYYTLALLRQVGVTEVSEAALAALRPSRDLFWLVRMLLFRSPRPSPKLSKLIAAVVSAEPEKGMSREWFLPSYRTFYHGYPRLSPWAARLLYIPWLARGMIRAGQALLKTGFPIRKT